MFFTSDFLQYVAWDGGRSLPVGATALSGLAAIDARTWLLLDNGTDGIYKTADGGVTWGTKTGLPTGVTTPSGLTVIDANTWLLLDNTTDGIYRTADGGPTWSTKIRIPAAATKPHGLSAIDANTWLLADNETKKIYKTTDAGATWDAGAGVPPILKTLRGVAAIDAATWIVSGQATNRANRLHITYDSGGTWKSVSAPPNSADPQGLAVIDANTWLIADKQARNLYTGFLLSNLNPRDRFRGLSGDYTLSFVGGPPVLNPDEKLYAFADGFADASGAVAPSLGEPQRDPYLGRYRVIKEFDAAPTLANFGRFSTVGSLLFFRESDIIRADRQFFVTYPFNVSVAPRATYVPLSDGTQQEIQLTDDPYVTFAINLVNTDDRHVEIRNAVIRMISSKEVFLFSDGDLSGPSHYLFQRESRKSLRHTWQTYNNQGLSVTVEAL